MNPIVVIKKDSNRLFVTAEILIVGALLTRGFPILSFIAFVPLFAFLDHPNNFRNSYRLIVASLFIGFVIYFITRENGILGITLYAIGVLLIFWAFAEVQNVRQNLMNKFALVIFVLGAEYIIVKFVPAEHGFFLADLLGQKSEWTRWNIYTGYLGSTFWILSTNMIFYQAIFKMGGGRKWTFLVAILLIAIPIIYSHNLSNHAITKTDMALLYATEGMENTDSRNGELISRTGAWVSVLIVIFTIVKSKTKQNNK